MPGRLRNQAVRAAFLMAVLAAGQAAASSEEKPAGPAGEVDPAALERGRAIFTMEAVPQCSICHTLVDAGAAGAIGPSLDDLKPTVAQVRLAVEGGVGAMPAYGDLLTEEQIDAVAKYVAAVAGER